MNSIDANTNCPFCGQEINNINVIKAFRAIFSEQYAKLAQDVDALKDSLRQRFDASVLAQLELKAERNISKMSFWNRFVSFAEPILPLPTGTAQSVNNVREEALALLSRKSARLLDPVEVTEEFMLAARVFAQVKSDFQSINKYIRAANVLIVNRKALVADVDLRVAEAELLRRRTLRNRHDTTVAAMCADYVGLLGAKKLLDEQRKATRADLETHSQTVVSPYEQRINEYLSAFNADFRIADTMHRYPAGIAASSYDIVINNTSVSLGDGGTPDNQASFRNTLSGGDRTTLALAFFLANLERDHELRRKVVVFDDPFNSQDAFRRRQTVHEISKIARECLQVIVLSHDPNFLKLVWEKAPTSERAALTITNQFTSGSKITSVDLEQICKGRTVSDIDDLQAYLTHGSGNPRDLIRKLRGIIETYLRTTYPTLFVQNDWLGDMVRKIREGGPTHPVYALYDEVDQINGYTSSYHHGEDLADSTTDQIDRAELAGFARRTLRLVNASQA